MSYRRTNAGGLLAVSAISLVFVLACVGTANAQVMVGNNITMLMNGSLGTVYSANYGDHIGSSHSLGLAVNGILEGYYYNPQFLSFQVHPYYDRAQSNAASQFITRGTGVDGSAHFFGGSQFPGSISYGRNFSGNSEFSIAGVPAVLVDSSGSNFNISWGALLKGLPTLQASYSIADSSSTLLGTTNESKSSSKNFNLNSSYALGGFDLQGTLGHYNTDLLSPDFLTPTTISSTSSNTNYSVTATRMLPLSGSLGLGWSRTTSTYGVEDFSTNNYAASAGFSPWSRLSLSGFCNYTTDAIVAFEQSRSGENHVSPFLNAGSNSNAMYMTTTGTLSVGHGLTATGYVNHRIQHFQGQELTNTQYGGTVNYQKTDDLFGFLRFSIGLVNSATQEGNNTAGLVGNLLASHKFGKWETTGDFNYSQHTQTLYDIVTTSNYTYGGMLRRKINSSAFWSASFREARSGLTAQEGNNNKSDSFLTNLSWEKYSLSGGYSRSLGEALLSTDGTLTPTPLGSPISGYFLTFNVRAYTVTASTELFRLLTLSGGYTNLSSNTRQNALGTFNNGDRYTARLSLRMRRLYFVAGFDRAKQESSAVLGGPRRVNSFYVSLSRWFNVF